MKRGTGITVVHIARTGAMTILILVCMFLPYLPGRYDGLATTLSLMSQLFGVVGLLLVPIGALWLSYELRKGAHRNPGGSKRDKGYYFAISSMVASSLVAAIVALGAFANLGLSLGLAVIALWTYFALRMVPRLKHLKHAEVGNFNPAPLYLLIIPTIVAIFQFTLVDRATEFSRSYAIEKSQVLIHDIEAYRKTNGRYPASLLALWTDYQPGVIGIPRFYYEPKGDAYNLFFEQFSNRVGTREIVMYNKLDEHFFTSHDSDLLLWTTEQLSARRTYLSVHDASSPHWKIFWFD